MPALLRPVAVTAGADVAVIAPCGPPKERLEAGLKVITSWGLNPIVYPHVRDVDWDLDFLAGNDTDRASDLVDAWCTRSIEAVFCARGGTGAQRLVEALTPAQIDRMRQVIPKPLIGFSDVTSLLTWMAKALGVMTVHGPVVTSLGEDPQRSGEHLRQLLLDPYASFLIAAGLERIDSNALPDTGPIVGPLIGGNVRILTTLAGTDGFYLPPNAIIIIEDIGEAPYRLDRTLTHLIRAGMFTTAAAVVCGTFSGTGDPALTMRVLVSRLGTLGVPVFGGAPIGHTHPNLAFHHGGFAQIDEGHLTLRPDLE